MSRRLLSLVIGFGLVIAACGDGGTTTTDPDPAATTTTVTPAPTATTSGPGPSSTTTPPTSTTTTTTAPTSTTAAPRADSVIEATIAGGVVTSPDRPEVALGSTVLLIVTADVAGEVHIHGYDYFLDLTSGAAAEIEFVADIPGIFEVELEDGHALIFELVVR